MLRQRFEQRNMYNLHINFNSCKEMISCVHQIVGYLYIYYIIFRNKMLYTST